MAAMPLAFARISAAAKLMDAIDAAGVSLNIGGNVEPDRCSEKAELGIFHRAAFGPIR
jgi:hypothetical protein